MRKNNRNRTHDNVPQRESTTHNSRHEKQKWRHSVDAITEPARPVHPPAEYTAAPPAWHHAAIAAYGAAVTHREPPTTPSSARDTGLTWWSRAAAAGAATCQRGGDTSIRCTVSRSIAVSLYRCIASVSLTYGSLSVQRLVRRSIDFHLPSRPDTAGNGYIFSNWCIFCAVYSDTSLNSVSDVSPPLWLLLDTKV
eukprot:2077321-Prymnesium_polylepis.2